MRLAGKRPPEAKYPSELKTIGDHILKRRLEMGATQREVALLICCDPISIYHWEKNQNQPYVKHYPAIIKFLGYNPLPKGNTIGEKILYCRMTLGLSRKKLAKRLGVDEGTLGRWELDRKTPKGDYLNLIDRLFLEMDPLHYDRCEI